jgi:hypothetical protein
LQDEVIARRATGRGAVLSMALCVMVLIASEFIRLQAFFGTHLARGAASSSRVR